MAKPRRLGRDSGLQARMLFTLFVLGLIYAVLIAALFAAGAGAVAIGAVACGLLLLQLLTSDRVALFCMGARTVSPRDAPDLHAVVERLCIQAGLPKPALAKAVTPMPNACAVGRSPGHSTICVTTGLLDLLTPAELEAVLAHELSHIQNRDVLVMTAIGFFGTVGSLVVQCGFRLGALFGGEREGRKSPGALIAPLVAGAVYVVSWPLLQTLSRYREFAADRGSALITGRPAALISALTKISGDMQLVAARDLRSAPAGMAAFYIVSPRLTDGLASALATHPPLERRIAALQRHEAQMPGAAPITGRR